MTRNGLTPDRRRALLSVAASALLALTALTVVLVWGRSAAGASLNGKVRSVAMGLRCPVCQGESVYDSPASLAGAMREVIRRRLEAGETPSQVTSYFVSRYGQWILLAPPPDGIGALVWYGPAGVSILGFFGLVSVVLLWRRRRGVAPSYPWEQGLQDRQDVLTELDGLERTLDDESLSDQEYGRRRQRLEALLTSMERVPGSGPVRGQRRALQLAIIGSTALAIAASVFAATGPRGSGAITGSVPAAAGTTTTPPRASGQPPDVVAAARYVAWHPKKPAAWVILASRMLIHREYTGARLAFGRALRLAPENQGARSGLAFLDIGQQRDMAALAILLPISAEGRVSPRLWLMEGLAYGRLPGGRYRAISAFHRFLASSPTRSLRSSVAGWIAQLQTGKSIP